MQHTMRRFCTHLTSFTLLFSFCALTGWSAEGLQVKIEKVVINSELKAEVTFTMQDDAGMPLTVEAAAPRFLIAVLNVLDAKTGSARYFSYNTRKQTVPAGYPNAGASADQATTDSGGTVKQLGPGKYVYTFKQALPANYDKTKTHTVGGQFTRLADEVRYNANPLYHFVPDGSPVTALRKVTTTETCNKCHVSMGFHGSGSRMEVGLCILCHQPQSTDPDTGNTVDMTTMIHKIHRSANLPSVKAGKPYQIVGNAQSLHDYSNIHFPQDVRNCQVCHTGEQGDLFKKAPSRQACGSCHDDINFDTGVGHMGVPQPNDSMCAVCHQPEGAEFSTAIDGAHTVPMHSTKLKGLVAEIVDVINAAPGQKPTVRFTLKEKDGTLLDPAKIVASGGSVAIDYAGPTTEYSLNKREAITATAPAELLDGVYSFTFANAIPADAKGTLAFSMEARRPVVLVDEPEGTPDLTVTEGAFNPIKLVAIDGNAPVARRTSVDLAKCNDCHGGTLALHGGQRFALEFCVFCHNPNNSDIGRRKDAAGNKLPGGESISFDYMIHKIHTGSHLEGDYTVYGFGNTPHPYKELVHYPGLRENCTSCHIEMPELPVAEAKQPINFVDNDGAVVVVAPTTASCTSCHDAKEVRAHASLNVTTGGVESCAVCHKEGRDASILEAHVVKIKNNVTETVASDSTPIDQWQVFGEE